MIMYSVVLIDDEQWVMEDLKTLADWESLGFRIAGEANDAETAKKVIAEQKPDLVISDIRMPELSGIQLLESYKDSDVKFKTVFVTAYGKFEYAQKALQLGAFGYLLKPVDPSELEETLKRVKDTLDLEAGATEQIFHFKRTKMLYSLLDSYNTNDDLVEKLNKIGINETAKPFVAVIANVKEGTEATDILPENWNTVALPLSNSKYFLFIQNKTEYFNLISLKNLLKELNEIAKRTGATFGVSRVMKSARKFRSAFMQAQNALDTIFLNGEKVNVYRDGSDRVKDVNAFIAGYKMNHSINELLSLLPTVLKENKINIDNLMPIITYLAGQIGVETESAETDSREIINQFPNIESYFAYLYQCVNESHKKGGGKTTSRYVIREITDYIKYNYNQKLMINDLAKKFFLNPSYLSNLFKVETGKSFTAFLVECRLNKAVELLENTELSLYEISSRVGYDDYFHFSKLFKKYMNISPANYRKNKSKKENEQS